MLTGGVGSSHQHSEVLRMKSRQRHGNWYESQVKNKATHHICTALANAKTMSACDKGLERATVA